MARSGCRLPGRPGLPRAGRELRIHSILVVVAGNRMPWRTMWSPSIVDAASKQDAGVARGVPDHPDLNRRSNPCLNPRRAGIICNGP
jgi:hypothetical protein